MSVKEMQTEYMNLLNSYKQGDEETKLKLIDLFTKLLIAVDKEKLPIINNISYNYILEKKKNPIGMNGGKRKTSKKGSKKTSKKSKTTRRKSKKTSKK
jgi:hypothetical protein